MISQKMVTFQKSQTLLAENLHERPLLFRTFNFKGGLCNRHTGYCPYRAPCPGSEQFLWFWKMLTSCDFTLLSLPNNVRWGIMKRAPFVCPSVRPSVRPCTQMLTLGFSWYFLWLSVYPYIDFTETWHTCWPWGEDVSDVPFDSGGKCVAMVMVLLSMHPCTKC